MGDTYSEDLAFVGPLPPMPGREAEGPLLLVRRAIFVPLPADLSNNFGRPDLPNPSCGDLCAYNQTRGTVFWGLVSGERNMTSLCVVRLPGHAKRAHGCAARGCVHIPAAATSWVTPSELLLTKLLACMHACAGCLRGPGASA